MYYFFIHVLYYYGYTPLIDKRPYGKEEDNYYSEIVEITSIIVKEIKEDETNIEDKGDQHRYIGNAVPQDYFSIHNL